ncbi:MAG: cation diffusion facilitator family transporter [Deltaproteobacteria bacterium]
MIPATGQTGRDAELLKFPMRLSLAVGFLMLAMKVFAFWITGSAAVLSDAAESVVHVVAVSFAAYSLWLSLKPPDSSHLYGHDKITFFSAGFEGAMIVLAAVYIIFVSIQKWIEGLHLENLGIGTILVLVAGLINGVLGGYLLWAGKKRGSLILEANGKHVLTDCWTSLGVIIGLSLTLLTGWLYFDPIFAIFVALNILWTGGNLIRRSIGGLMDEVDSRTQARILGVLREMCESSGVQFHGLRHRNAGNTIWVEVHLLFPEATSLKSAHELATKIEERIEGELGSRAEVITHLETLQDHDQVHAREHYKDL